MDTSRESQKAGGVSSNHSSSKEVFKIPSHLLLLKSQVAVDLHTSMFVEETVKLISRQELIVVEPQSSSSQTGIASFLLNRVYSSFNSSYWGLLLRSLNYPTSILEPCYEARDIQSELTSLAATLDMIRRVQLRSWTPAENPRSLPTIILYFPS